jgi:hypothetical protein
VEEESGMPQSTPALQPRLSLGPDTPTSTPQPARPASASVLTTAEVAECTCPEFCERDHERD